LSGGDVFFSLTPLVENLVAAGTLAVQAAKAAGIRKIRKGSVNGIGIFYDSLAIHSQQHG
jgi:hypothetical protein